MNMSDRNGRTGFSEQDFINVLSRFEEMNPTDFSFHNQQLSGDYQNLTQSDYAKVIFCDLYYNADGTVGCRFQITDNVHEDPCDCIGLFRVGYDNLSQCLASKLLSDTVCEDDGKMIRCTFKPSELPELENGFYQFLYVTRENEVCGASMPFNIKNSITKGLCSDEDVVADNSEDDFLVVRSNIAEKNRRLQTILDEMTEKCLKHEGDMRKTHDKLKIINEEKNKFENLFKKANDESKILSEEVCKVKEERNIVCREKEEAIRILREKNRVFSSMFDDYSEKLQEFAALKDQLLEDKNNAIAESVEMRNDINKLTEDLKKRQATLEAEQNKNQALMSSWKNESYVLSLKLDEANATILELENKKDLTMVQLNSLNERVAILREQLKDAKCENLALNTKLTATSVAYEQREDEFKSMKSEVENTRSEMTALKLHIIELHESKLSPQESKFEEKDEELQSLKTQYAELQFQLKEKKDTILKMQEGLISANKVVENLSKEKVTLQEKANCFRDALNECIVRLNEGSELYKMQFRKIEKLKKKLKSKPDLMVMNSTAASMKDSCSSDIQFADEKTAIQLQSSDNQNSDSDTGEHVLRQPKTKGLFEYNGSNKRLYEFKEATCYYSPESDESVPTSPRVRDVPELQTLIERNLEKFSLEKKSQTKKEDEVMYSIPCPVCEQDVGVYMSSTEELVKHLEVQHKQQVCPICGRLYDMTLPPKYFLFHVEDHFIKEKKK